MAGGMRPLRNGTAWDAGQGRGHMQRGRVGVTEVFPRENPRLADRTRNFPP
jgi:hypothetical protein